uniref:Glycosyltransferase family 92 protein n=1 Tax=viral metagenome TaxID=1070528 RepID=A0A6C0H6C6_9ZZZZ
MKPVIVCIAKLEHNYIENFVKYHLSIGFDKIYLYDNEDVPTYNVILKDYMDKIEYMHLPGNNYDLAVQYYALLDFVRNHINKQEITHVIHIDIDEYIVLKKHSNIKEFINEYIKDDCAGIGINWRFFGSCGHQDNKDNEADPIRFTMCDLNGDRHIKTLFDKSKFIGFNECHSIKTVDGYFIKNTKNKIINGPFNDNIDLSVIQLNHYKCKTMEEFRYIRSRGRADIKNWSENVEEEFMKYDKNDTEDFTCHDLFIEKFGKK